MEGKRMFDLSGKVALVTGGGSGIGRAYCEAMAEFGAEVVCNDIVEEKAQETVELIGRFGHRAIAIKADASKEGEIEYMVSKTVEEFGTIDVAFSNACTGDRNLVKIHEKPVEDFDIIFAFQPRGTFILMRAVFPIMMKKKIGSFITTASVGGLTVPTCEGSFGFLTAYNTCKAAVIMLTKMAAKQYGEYGIRVNAICPGYQRTNIGTPEGRAKMEEIIAPLTPLGRVGIPEELKGLAIWLASDASSFVSGQTFVQDGGMSA